MNDPNTISQVDNPYSVGESALLVGGPPMPGPDEENQAYIAFTKQSVPLLFILALVTFAIYVPYWYLSRREELNRINTSDKLNSGPFIVVLVMYAIGALLTVFSIVLDLDATTIAGLDSLDRVFNLIGGITLLVQSFKIKRMLEHYTGMPHSGVATFFFQYLYLQHKINQARPADNEF